MVTPGTGPNLPPGRSMYPLHVLTPFSSGAITHALLVIVAFLAVPQPVYSQTSNVSVYQELAVGCFGNVPDDLPAFKVAPPSRMPFIRSALVTHWTQQGSRVFLADSVYSEMPDPLAQLTYGVETAQVRYARLKKKRMARTVELVMPATLHSASGEVLYDNTCRQEKTDTLAIADLNRIQSSTYPETTASPPKAGWSRRILEPVVLTGATVVGVYLFFTLRSTGSDDGG